MSSIGPIGIKSNLNVLEVKGSTNYNSYGCKLYPTLTPKEKQMAFKKGMAAIKESLEKSQNKPAKFEATNWFAWKAGETKVVRFLTDAEDIITTYIHGNVIVQDGSKKTFVCRKVFDAPCELCESGAYRAQSGYGIAVLRQEAYEDVDGQKKLVGYKDVTTSYEVEENGKTVVKRKPYVGIVNQSLRNFWGPVNLIWEKFGSLKDRDIEIVRQGSDTSTQYMPFALDKKPIENIDERYAKFLPDLEKFLTRIGSEEYYQAQLHGIKPEKTETSSSTDSDDFDDEYEDDSVINIDEETTADRLRKKLAAN